MLVAIIILPDVYGNSENNPEQGASMEKPQLSRFQPRFPGD